MNKVKVTHQGEGHIKVKVKYLHSFKFYVAHTLCIRLKCYLFFHHLTIFLGDISHKVVSKYLLQNRHRLFKYNGPTCFWLWRSEFWTSRHFTNKYTRWCSQVNQSWPCWKIPLTTNVTSRGGNFTSRGENKYGRVMFSEMCVCSQGRVGTSNASHGRTPLLLACTSNLGTCPLPYPADITHGDLQPLSLSSPFYWHQVDITEDLFKLAHMRTYSPSPPVLISSVMYDWQESVRVLLECCLVVSIS